MCSWQLADYAKIPRISCVYSITHGISGREYIGRTVDLRDRARKHWQEIMSGTHKNPKITRTFNKYGGDFSIAPLVLGSIEYCTMVEGKLLETIDLKESLNCHRNSNGGWLGMKFSDEVRAKLSEMRIGRPFTDQMRKAQSESRKHSASWKAHQDWMKTPEAISARCEKAAHPDVRERAVATRRKNGHKPFSDESRKRQMDEAKSRVFAALNWAVENKETRGTALKMFSCSWGGLKKYQPEWEAINGPLMIPKRASGERNGKFKHGLSKEIRRKRTTEELAIKHQKHSEQMRGENNPMHGRKHTEDAKRIQSESARRQSINKKQRNIEIS